MVAIIRGSLIYDFARDSIAFDAASGDGSIHFWMSRKTLLALAHTNIEHADDLLSEFERYSGLIQVAAIWKLNTVQTGEGGIELTSADLAKVTHILPSDAG